MVVNFRAREISRSTRKLTRIPILIKREGTRDLSGGPVIRTWDQEIYSFCGFRFEPCGCSYDGHWRLT